MIPQAHRNFFFLCSFHGKSATTLYLNRIAIAQHRMLYAECMDVISVHLKIFILLIELYAFYLKRQLRRNRPKCSDNPCKPLRSNNGKRLGALGISHCKKKPRQSADMVCMKVGDAQNIYRLEIDSGLLHRNLRSLTAVNKYIAAVIF